MLLQGWEWCFLKFDLPLHQHGAPHTARCTVANLMATQSPPRTSFSSPPLALVLRPHGRKHVDVSLVGHVESLRRPPGMRVVLVVCFSCLLIFGQFRLIFVR